MAKVRNESSHYSTFSRENNVTLVQSFIHNDLKAMVTTIMARDDVKLGAFIEWAVAVGVNEANKTAGVEDEFDMMRLHYANHTRRSSRVTNNALRQELDEMKDAIAKKDAQIEQLIAALTQKASAE